MTQTLPPDISSRMSAAWDEPVHDDRHGGPGLLREVIDDVLSKTLFDSPLGAAVAILVVLPLAICTVGLVHGLVTSIVDQVTR